MYPQVLLSALSDVAITPLPERPRLAPWLTFVELGDGRLQLRASDFTMTLSEPLLAKALRQVAPVLDGEHTVSQICATGAPAYLPGTVLFVLKLLAQGGALHEGAPAPELSARARTELEPALRLFAHYTRTPERTLARLQQAVVVVGGSGELVRRVADSLTASGVGRVLQVSASNLASSEPIASPEAPDLVIAAAETRATAFFTAVNGAQLARGGRWLRVALDGRYATLGPTVVPHQTACFTCYHSRRACHDDSEQLELYERALELRGEHAEGSLHGLLQVIAGQTALEAARLLTGFAPPATLGRFHLFEASGPGVTGHDVLRVPRCPSCGPRISPRDPWDTRAARKAEP
jgi:bacteriocin biosynthesis cyclodehydratase domain-containing protein